jgi:hypothetical protein
MSISLSSLQLTAGIAQSVQWLGYGLDDKGIGISQPEEARDSSFLDSILTSFGAHPNFYGMATEGSFPGGKLAEALTLIIHHLIQRLGMLAATPPLPLTFLCHVGKHKDDFLFTNTTMSKQWDDSYHRAHVTVNYQRTYTCNYRPKSSG